jgi:hypothetical protein
MSKTKSTKTRDKKDKKITKKGVVWNFPYNKKDLMWLLIGVCVVALGFLLMATGISDEPSLEGGAWMNFWAVDAAPIVLFLGYGVIIPMALFKFFSRSKFFNKNKNETINE